MTERAVRCRTCDHEVDRFGVERGRAWARCPRCADRTELRCLQCRGLLAATEAGGSIRGWCRRCGWEHSVVDGRLVLGEERREVLAPEPARAEPEPQIEPSEPEAEDAGEVETAEVVVAIEDRAAPDPESAPMEAITDKLSIRRLAHASRVAGFRDAPVIDGWELERAPRRFLPRSWLASPILVFEAFFVVLGFCFAAPSWLIPIHGVVEYVFTIAGHATLALGGGSMLYRWLRHRREERRHRARGFETTQRMRVDDDGVARDDHAPIPRARIAAVDVEAVDRVHRVRVRLDDGEEVVLLDGLLEHEAELVERRVADELGLERAEGR